MLPLGDDNSQRRTTPYVTYGLIALNVIVFLIELASGDRFIEQWSFVPARFAGNPVTDFPTIFTAMFMHAGWLHLGGNMLYLWIFGDNVEDFFGHVPYAIFYVVCGVGATFAQMAFNLGSGVPNLGASGAIAGALGSYILLYPQARVSVSVGYGLTQMPAWIVIGFWFVLQLFSGVGSIASADSGGGVAYMAHVGGFAAGFVLTFLMREIYRQPRLPY